MLGAAAIGALAWPSLGPTRRSGAVGAVASRTGPPPGSRPLPVRTARLEHQDAYEVTRYYTGQVLARRSSQLSFERTGKVVELRVDDGCRVAAGEVVARLDADRLEAERRRLVAEREAARALLDEMVAGPRREKIDQARAELARAEARHERLKRLAERLQQEFVQSAVSEDRIDAAVFDAKAALGELHAARSSLEELLTGTRKETIVAQRARIEALDAQVDSIDVDLARSVLRVPFAGTIERRLVDEGEIIRPGDPVVSVTENARLEVRVGVPVATASKFEIASEESVVIDGVEVPGKVRAILPTLEATTRTVQVILDVDPPADRRFFPGQIARLRVTRSVPQEGFWVPAGALVEGHRGLWALYVVEEPQGLEERQDDVPGNTSSVRRTRRADIEILHHEGDRVFVRGALLPGQEIIPAGAHRVVSGQRVQITRESANAGRGTLPEASSTSAGSGTSTGTEARHAESLLP